MTSTLDLKHFSGVDPLGRLQIGRQTESPPLHKHLGVSARCVKKHWQTYRPQHRRDTGVSPDQPRDAMLPACPGSSPGNPSPKWTCHEVPSQTFKLHQQHVYSERLQNDEAPPFFSKSESSQSPTLLTPH